MMQFAGFTPRQKFTILNKMGYGGPAQDDEMEAFMMSRPESRSLVQKLERKARQMQGIRNMNEGGDTGETELTEDQKKLREAAGNVALKSYSDPASLAKKPAVTEITEQPGTIIDGTTVGQVGDPTKVTTTTTAAPTDITAETYAASQAKPAITTALEDVSAAQGTVSDEAQVAAATKEPTETAVGDLEAAQGTGILMENPVQREIQEGELISGVADAQKASKFTEQIQAAQATPTEKATIQGQLDGLMQQFEGGNTPAWAAGAMRAATATMAARGLSASSIAGQAVIQAAMESALPIAQADASTQASFEMQNLTNRQQRAMLAAQQRAEFMGQEFDQAFQARVQNAAKIADVANMNFTAEQQIALENSRIVNTMNLQNLSNKQAMVMAEAAAVSQLEQQNLSNEQQAAVQNAQSFLQMDMQNLSNEQQTEMFKAQTVASAILTDTAADNAAKQFNASSENQTKQFMKNLATQVAMQNTAQLNAGEQFNAQVQNNRDQFNATNGLVIAQSNAQWRQNITTLNTAAQNEANMVVAQLANNITTAAMEQLWQRERDMMDYAFKGTESSKERALELILADKKYDEYAKARADAEETAKWEFFTDILLG